MLKQPQVYFVDSTKGGLSRGLKLHVVSAKTGEEEAVADFVASAEQISLGGTAAAAIADGKLCAISAGMLHSWNLCSQCR